MRTLKTILTAVFSSSEDDVEGGAALKIFMLQRPDYFLRCSLSLLIDTPSSAITQHVIHPLLALILSLCRDSIPISALPFSTLFLSLPKLYSLPLFAFPYTQKTNYNTAKSIWVHQASHSVGEGG